MHTYNSLLQLKLLNHLSRCGEVGVVKYLWLAPIAQLVVSLSVDPEVPGSNPGVCQFFSLSKNQVYK